VTVRYLFLAFAVGCTTSEPSAADEDVGEAISQIATCPAGQWCIEPSPSLSTGAPLLHSVWAVNADNVFAVGDMGAIFHRVSGTWTVMPSGTTNSLRGVWAASASDVWAGGVGGTILRFNGTVWTTITGVTTSDVDAVWGSSSNDVWLVGSGVVTHWNGTTFTQKLFGGILLSVSGTGPTDVWASGENSGLLHWNGSTWTTITPLKNASTLFAVLAMAPSDVWVTDFLPGKETVHFNGSAWTPQGAGGGIFDGLAGFASNDVWGAGGTRVGHWNGSAWTTTLPFGSNVSLWSVATTPGNAWIVGDSGLIAHQAF
jgi:hypothetical protein